MKNFVLGILQIVGASVIINWMYNITANINYSFTAPKEEYRMQQPIPTATMQPKTVQTETEKVREDVIILTSGGTRILWDTLDLALEYDDDKYSYKYRSNMVEKYRPNYLEGGDKYKVVSQRLPFNEIEIVEPRKSPVVFSYILRVGIRGWAKN